MQPALFDHVVHAYALVGRGRFRKPAFLAILQRDVATIFAKLANLENTRSPPVNSGGPPALTATRLLILWLHRPEALLLMKKN